MKLALVISAVALMLAVFTAWVLLRQPKTQRAPRGATPGTTASALVSNLITRQFEDAMTLVNPDTVTESSLVRLAERLTAGSADPSTFFQTIYKQTISDTSFNYRVDVRIESNPPQHAVIYIRESPIGSFRIEQVVCEDWPVADFELGEARAPENSFPTQWYFGSKQIP